MHPTVALVVLWVAGIGVALAIVGALVHWLFFDTATGEVPDQDMIANSRAYVANDWSMEAADDHEALCEREYGKCHQETRWQRLMRWWFGERPPP